MLQWQREAIIAAQRNTCYYCGINFNETVMRNGSAVRIKVHIDHVIPWSLGGDNAPENLVAACHVCNGIKSARTFSSVEACREFVLMLREHKGYVAPVGEYRVSDERKKAVLMAYTAKKATREAMKIARNKARDALEFVEREKRRVKEKEEAEHAMRVKKWGLKAAEEEREWVREYRARIEARDAKRRAEQKELARMAKLGSVTGGNR